MGKRFAILLLVVGCWLLVNPKSIHAADFRTDYVTEYTPEKIGSELVTHVKLDIGITNLRSDLVIKKMSLMFPKDFKISKLQTSENGKPIDPVTDGSGSSSALVMEFSEPEVGRDKVNRLVLQFDQEKLFQENGNIWEVILPVISSEQKDSYKVVFNLPQDHSKKISIAKPAPDLIENGKAIWNNFQGKAIYAAFGDAQYYGLHLNYSLYNPKLVSVYTDIAFPPDTLYQKVYLESLSDKPAEIIVDDDGNYLGRYYLRPQEKREIDYRGTAEIFATPRKDLRAGLKANLERNKPALLSAQGYWKLDDPNRFSGSLKDIYGNIVSTFSYDYTRNLETDKRMGASKALQYPGKAVCTEFTDAFVGFARSKGVPAREIQGFGFSREEIRPITYESDILHAWPEYFDDQTNAWKPVDPTWENTSGIDYFTQLDFNHIAFVIHGKDSSYPAPAGSYKTAKGKSVDVTPSNKPPEEKVSMVLSGNTLPDKVVTGRSNKITFTIENTGNVFLWNVPFELNTTAGSLSVKKWNIESIAPLQRKTLETEYIAEDTKVKNKTEFSVLIMGKTTLRQTVNVIPYYYDIALKVSLVFAALMVLFSSLILAKIIKIKRIAY